MNFQERSVLELLKTQLATLETSATKLDDKAQQNISVSSVIVALVSALQLRPEDELPIGTVSTIFIILIFIVYAAVFLLSYWARLPRDVVGPPLNPDKATIKEWLGRSDSQYYSGLVNSYVDAIASHAQAVREKARLVRVATFLIGVDVLLIFLGVLVQAVS
ncbi:MAG TPA: hypothetical protein PKD46_17070 [Aggregatilineaceae bacterium]|nr:hypothetical protein [Anaerolineae bacterium]HMM29996.1 hypothetical protein [Aggregatilineaceae bacterium]